MRIFITSILSIVLFIPLSAQEDVIKLIKDQYYQISTNTQDYNIHEVEMNFMLPAVGLRTKTIKFYYNSIQTNPEIDPYEMAYSLLKVEVKFNVSAHSLYTLEYLYNDKGQLIFYFDKLEGPYETHQKRFYFQKGELIKCIIHKKSETGKIEKYSKTDLFLDENLDESIKGIEKAGQYSDLFKHFKFLDKVEE